MKKSLILMGILIVTALGCEKKYKAEKPVSPDNPILMPGGLPKGVKLPPDVQKRVEEQNKELEQRK